MSDDYFTVTAEHIALLQRMYWEWADYETGAPSVNGKRPYGNSYVAGDVAEILGWEIADEDEGLTREQEVRALDLHGETLDAVQEIIRTARPSVSAGSPSGTTEAGNAEQ